MLTMIKRVRGSAISFLTVILLLVGCAPPGVRAFREGNQLLDKGRFPEAIEQLKVASSFLPTNAVVWNALGVAYQRGGQPAQADVAYQRALALDRDLKEARYNLGCLMLEQKQTEIARAHFTTLAIRGDPGPEVLAKLGTAHLRLRDLNSAEKAYTDSLQLSPKNLEALNGLGIVKAYRNRPQEALPLFTAALKEKPEFSAAALNSAVIKHQLLRDPQGALADYREFLRLGSDPQQKAAVAQVISVLEAELKPVAAQPTVVNTNSPVPAPDPTNDLSEVAAEAPPPKTNVAARVEPELAAAKPAASSATGKPSGSAPPKIVAANPPPSARTTRPSTSTPPTVVPRVETVSVPPEPVIRPADDTPVMSRPVKAPQQVAKAEPAASSDSGAEAKQPAAKRGGFLHSVNPLRLFNGSEKPAETAASGARDSDSESSLSLASPRYKYTSPSAPVEGNNAEAKKAFTQGLQAQSQQKSSEAVLAYLRATQLDPAFFEAQFNLALAYQQAGNTPAALKSYEQALAIRPNHAEARYNFALLLKDSNYLADSLAEFEKLLAANPHHANGNLALANLYAQQLRQPNRARPYFQRVLEINPRHPQANAIRYWLSANP